MTVKDTLRKFVDHLHRYDEFRAIMSIQHLPDNIFNELREYLDNDDIEGAIEHATLLYHLT